MNVGVFFGSRSTEHDISILTAQVIISVLKEMDCLVTPVYITKKGHWMIGKELGNLKTFIDPNSPVDEKKGFQQYVLDLEKSIGKIVLKKKGIASKEIIIDLAFPAFHGAYGEDGTMQGMFEMFDIPYVGCDTTSSAIAMDKVLTKQICKVNDIPITNFIYFSKEQWSKDKKTVLGEIKKKLSFPVFVKPAHLGSSIGIAKVEDKDSDELENKIEVGLYYDSKILVEEGVEKAMDVTCCAIGNEKVTTSVLQESIFKSDLYDFEEKYLKDGGSQLGKAESGVAIPARLDSATTKTIQKMTEETYRALGCSGIARVDFLYDKKTKNIYMNEVNPLPGTLYHHLWEKSGIKLPELLKSLIDLAERKKKEKEKIARVFSSNVLSGLNSTKLNLRKK